MLQKSITTAKRRVTPEAHLDVVFLLFSAIKEWILRTSPPAAFYKISAHKQTVSMTFLLSHILATLLIISPASAMAASFNPLTWNIIGLDSNTPSFGPSVFPVGAEVCSSNATETVNFVWDDGLDPYNGNAYINLRSGSQSSIVVATAGGCAYASFEVAVTKTSAAFDNTRAYHLTAATGGSTPTPRELYVERLVSQSRNGITDVKYALAGSTLNSVPSGGALNLVVGNTYDIELDGFTATSGYNQFESFISFSNTLFQIISISSTYNTASVPTVPSPINPSQYADACTWVNNPLSPNYRSCLNDYKAGGTVTTKYRIKIISGGGTSEALNTLLYDFSGSSYHYNADYSTGARIINIIDPASVTIAKSFSPSTTSPNGTATLTFTITNPNGGPVSGLNFIDDFTTVSVNPAGGVMKVDATPGASTSGCGTPTFAPLANATSISFSNGTVAASSSCTIKVNVTADLAGTYSNTSGHLFAGTKDTCKADNSNLSTCRATNDLIISSSGFTTGTSTCGFAMATCTPVSGTLPTCTTATNITATPSYNVGTTGGSSTITTMGGNAAWQLSGFQKATTPVNNTAPYYQLGIGGSDLSKYTNLAVTFDTYATSSWGTSNYIDGWASANGGTFNATSPATANLVKQTWTLNQTVSSATTGSTTSTDFRLNAFGANPSGAAMGLKNILVKGCRIPDHLTIQKTFQTNPVGVNGFSVLRFDLVNPNAVALTGVKFVDALPSGLKVYSTPAASTSNCGTPTWAPLANDTTLNFGQTTGATIPANGTCTVYVTIQATTAGVHANVSSFVSSTESGTNTTATGIATATLTAVLPPVISKQFSSNPILVNGISKLVFTITNPNINNTLSGVTFSDTLPTSPGAMKVAATPNVSYSGCGAGAFSPALTGNETAVTFASGTIQPGESCQVSVDITAPTQSQMATIATRTSDTALTLSANYAGSNASGLTVAKFNPSTSTITPISGTVTVNNGSSSVTGSSTLFLSELANGDIVYIGSYKNTTGTVSATTAGNGNTASDTLAVSPAHPAITLLKQVSTSSSGPWFDYLAVPSTATSVYYKFTVENPGDVDLSSVGVKDPPTAGSPLSGCSWGTLAKYNTVTCTRGPVAVVTGSPQQNDARAYGTYSSTTVQDDDYAIYASTHITLTKSATESYFTAEGNPLNYSFIVSNDGAAILDGPITVTDTVTSVTPNVAVPVTCPSLTTVGDHDDLFDPGESITCTPTATYTVTSNDVTAQLVTNTALASTAAVGLLPAVTSDSVNKTIPMASDLAAIKTNSVGGTAPGNSFVWTLTVRNTITTAKAVFASGQTILTDDLPSSGATYVLGSPVKTGVTGTINCAIASSSLNCTASGGNVTFSSAITGTVQVTQGSDQVIGTGTLFNTELTVNSVLIIANIPYTVKSIESDSALTLKTNYAATSASGLKIPGSFTVPVTVTITSIADKVNPRSGGICKADTNGVIIDSNSSNNSCADTVTVGMPLLTILKATEGGITTANPGGTITYIVQINNTGNGNATITSLTDNLSPYGAFSLNYNSGNRFEFTDSSPASGLVLGTPKYSENNGSSWDYVPVSGGGGAPANFDGKVTNWKFEPTGFVRPGGSFTLKYQIAVK